MASNCPIVSTDVGDVRDVISNTEGCFISSFEPSDVAEKIIRSFKYEGKTNGRTKIYHLDSKVIAEKIRTVYKSCSK
jgi:glycosyltransferase involved in cell wall biosynthesis